PELGRLYRQLHGLLRPGGVFLNGDRMAFDRRLPRIRAMAREANHRRARTEFARSGAETWDTYWRRLAEEPSLRAEFSERHRRFPKAHHGEEEMTADRHEQALRSAGFGEVAVVWQEIDNRVLLAIRSARRA
ncbi:MAG: SAM-dependent methyltransferase, partial [Thermoplasmata archaeon]|nr:SAM-dependent methyltransferase [Thermoplasmata archaeon]